VNTTNPFGYWLILSLTQGVLGAVLSPLDSPTLRRRQLELKTKSFRTILTGNFCILVYCFTTLGVSVTFWSTGQRCSLQLLRFLRQLRLNMAFTDTRDNFLLSQSSQLSVTTTSLQFPYSRCVARRFSDRHREQCTTWWTSKATRKKKLHPLFFWSSPSLF
jgi:hypothetical protein